MATALETSFENKHLGNGDYFVIIAYFIVDIEVNIENERFTAVCSCCH